MQVPSREHKVVLILIIIIKKMYKGKNVLFNIGSRAMLFCCLHLTGGTPLSLSYFVQNLDMIW